MNSDKSTVVLTNNVAKKQLTRNVAIALETCVRCGLCADSCHYYLASPLPENIPAYRGEALRRFTDRLQPLAALAGYSESKTNHILIRSRKWLLHPVHYADVA